MKKITFFIFLLISSFGFSQSLPLDFEVAEDDAFEPFNGAVVSVKTDPTDANNKVLELVGNGAAFDGAAITLDTFIDLSDDSDNTITLKVWSPDAATRTHLLKLEGGTSGATELTFTTNASGWQTVSIDFGSDLGNEYPVLTLFPDFNNADVGTYYIDDIDGPNGAEISGPTPDIETPAPSPTTPDSEVLSIYSDTGGFTNVWTEDYSFGEVSFVDLDQNETNEAIKMDFSIAGWGKGTNNTTNIDAYDWLHFDYYVDNRFPPGSQGEQILFILIDNAGSVVEYNYELTLAGGDGTLETGTWVGVDVPLSFFENKGFDKTAFFQFKLGTESDLKSKIVYFDNIFFSENQAILSSDKFFDTEVSIYPNPSSSYFNIESQLSIDHLKVFNLLGQTIVDVKQPSRTIDVTGLNSGVYLVQLSSGQQNVTKRLIIK